MFPTDPVALAAKFLTPGAVAGWLTDFLAALPFSSDEMEPVVAILSNFQPGDGTGSAGAEDDPATAAMMAGADATTAESRRAIRKLVAGYHPA